MTRALPTKDKITLVETINGRTSYSITNLKLKKPSCKIIAIDLGTLFTKAGMLDNCEVAYVEKVENFLSEVSSSRSRLKGSFSRKSGKNDLTVTYQGRCYSLGKSGIISGGQTNLETDKTDNVIPRILVALTLYDVGIKENEEIILCVAIDYKNEKDFARKDKIIKKAVENGLTWGTNSSARKVKVKQLIVTPEDYDAEAFNRLITDDELGFEDSDRATIGIGFRTLNLGIITSDGYFDDERSTSFDGKGTSLFYQWIASELGIENWNTPEFINGVNSGSYRPRGESEEIDMKDAIALATGWYMEEIMRLVQEHIPSEIQKFVIPGGGAIKFGSLLKENLWGETAICPKADVANCLGQLLSAAIEL